MTTKQYPIVCPSCGGKGRIQNPEMGYVTTTIWITCPACKGEKTVICTETISDYLGCHQELLLSIKLNNPT